MDDCRHIRSRFTAYLDGDLRNAERETVDVHLRDCADCQADFAAFREFLLNCDEFLAAPPPTYTFDSLRARMADIEPLAEIIDFVPKMHIHGAVPRFALSVMLMVLVGGLPGALRHSREVAQQLRSPIIDHEARLLQRIEETLDRDLAARADLEERMEIHEREAREV